MAEGLRSARFIRLRTSVPDAPDNVDFILVKTTVQFIKLPPRAAPPTKKEEFIEFEAVTRPATKVAPFEQRFRVTITGHVSYRPGEKRRAKRYSSDEPPEASVEMVGTLDEIEAVRGAVAGFMERFKTKRAVVGETDDFQPVTDRESRIVDSSVFINQSQHPAETRNLKDTLKVAFR